MSILAKKKALFKNDPVADLFPVLGYDDNLFYLEDGDDKYLGYAFIAPPMPGVDDSVADKLHVFHTAEMPFGSFIQWTLWASPDISDDLAVIKQLRANLYKKEDETSELLKASLDDEMSFYDRGTREPVEHRNSTRIRDIVNIITIKMPVMVRTGTEDERKKVQLARSAAIKNLENAGCYVKSLDPEQYIRLISSMLNWGENPSWKENRILYDPTRHINEQLVDIDNRIDVADDGIMLGKKHVRVLSVKYPPETAVLCNAVRYIGEPRSGARGIRDNFFITMTFYYPDTEVLRATLAAKQQTVNFQAYGPLYKYNRRLGAQKESFDTLFTTLDDGDKPVKVNLTFVVYADSEAEVAAASANMRTFYRDMQFTLQEDVNFNLPLFANALPFGAEKTGVMELRRYKTMGVRSAIHMLPIMGDSKGTGTPAFTLISRNGQLMKMDVFDSDTNLGTIIAAESGAGKSFFVNRLITSYRTLGAQVFVIDNGHSYSKINQALNGDFVEFNKNNNIRLNPFKLITNYEDEADILSALITTMAFPTEQISDLQQAALKEVLNACWYEKQNDLTIDYLAERLKEEGVKHNDTRLIDLGRQLFPFTSKGEYGIYFNGENNMSFTNDFTVLELADLKARPHLQSTVLLMLIIQIQRATYHGDVSKRKLVILDEAWQHLSKDGAVEKFLVDAYRRFRKVNTVPVVITQGVSDLYMTDGGRAIAENSANMFLLKQRAETIDQLQQQRRLSIGEGAFEALKTVHTVRGEYSEIFVYTNRCVGIGRLIVNRFNQLLYTTDPSEVGAIKRQVETGLTYTDAIRTIIQLEQRNRVH